VNKSPRSGETMKALVLAEYGRLVYEDMPRPKLGPGDVLVEVKACGICGSDVHGLDGSTGRRRPPVIMGHEASGVVAEVGAGVSGWKVGDRVTFDSTIYCGRCRFCRDGKTNLCDDRTVLGVSCEEYRRDGAFAQFVSVPERVLHRLPDALSFECAALVEPLSVACHAARRTRAQSGDSAVVVGAGVIGLFVIGVLRARGCAPVIALDIDPARLERARELGADAALKADEADVVGEIKRRTDGRGADAAFEAVGVSETVRTAVEAVRKGGSLALIGNLSPEARLPLQAVVTREITLYGSCASSGEYDECLEMMASGAVDAAALISAVAPLSEGAAWFRRLADGETALIKVLLIPGD